MKMPVDTLMGWKGKEVIFQDIAEKCACKYVDGTKMVQFPIPEWAFVKMHGDTLMGSKGNQ